MTVLPIEPEIVGESDVWMAVAAGHAVGSSYRPRTMPLIMLAAVAPLNRVTSMFARRTLYRQSLTLEADFPFVVIAISLISITVDILHWPLTHVPMLKPSHLAFRENAVSSVLRPR